jgi:hypothetical protein
MRNFLFLKKLTIMISRFLVVACGNPSRCMTASIEAIVFFSRYQRRKLRENSNKRTYSLEVHYYHSTI